MRYGCRKTVTSELVDSRMSSNKQDEEDEHEEDGYKIC